MSGGFDEYSYELVEPSRLENLKKVLKQTEADIVSLVDTFRWDEIYNEQKLKGMLGYNHVYCANLNDDRLRGIGHNNGITVLSNVESTKFKTIDLKTRICVRTSITINSTDVHIYSLYLDDLSEDTRLDQIFELSKYIEAEVPSIIVGDLNTFSSKDVVSTKRNIENLLIQKPQYEVLRDQLYDMARGEVIDKLFDLDFKDSA